MQSFVNTNDSTSEIKYMIPSAIVHKHELQHSKKQKKSAIVHKYEGCHTRNKYMIQSAIICKYRQ
jgi:hypothetical protein